MINKDNYGFWIFWVAMLGALNWTAVTHFSSMWLVFVVEIGLLLFLWWGNIPAKPEPKPKPTPPTFIKLRNRDVIYYTYFRKIDDEIIGVVCPLFQVLCNVCDPKDETCEGACDGDVLPAHYVYAGMPNKIKSYSGSFGKSRGKWLSKKEQGIVKKEIVNKLSEHLKTGHTFTAWKKIDGHRFCATLDLDENTPITWVFDYAGSKYQEQYEN